VTRHIAIATCDDFLPDGYAEDAGLATACRQSGIGATIASWTDPGIDWDSFDLTVIRSTWDYTVRREEFLSWLHRVPRLHNPADVVAPNIDKVYLRELAAAGLPVVPTAFAAPGEAVELPQHGEFVVKPSVGAGSRALLHVAHLHDAGRTVLIQPYLTGVDTAGESAMIYLDGRFSHSVRKAQMLPTGAGFSVFGDALYVEENISARVPSKAELDVAGEVLAQLSKTGPEPLLYARIDLLPSAAGPVLVEAELAEPSLFLDFDPGATTRFVDAISARLG
jgi:hypothetical protein